MPDPINRYMQWPLNSNEGDVFKSETGSSWVFDGCGWVSTCCPPTIPCDPEVNGISVIYARKGNTGLNESFGVSYFTWNSNLNRYDGYLDGPLTIHWTGFQWRFMLPGNPNIIATSATSNILDAVWNTLSPYDTKFSIEQVECGLIYKQLCVDTTYTILFPGPISPRGPFTLYPEGYPSIEDILNGFQAIIYTGVDSNGNQINLSYDSIDGIWYMDDDYGNSWQITAAPNQNALILGSDWIDLNNVTHATFDQGTCETECYPRRDGITLVYDTGSYWTPIYLTWNDSLGGYYTDNQYINELWGWNWVKVKYNGASGLIEISIDNGSGSQVIGENNYTGSYGTTLFNHYWSGGFDVFCGSVGCTRMCAIFNGNATTMVPYGYSGIEDLLACNKGFAGWVGWNGTNEVIYFNWDDAISNTYALSIDGASWQNTGITSHTSAALIAASPYSYNQNGVIGTLTLTSGDC